ncbi:MAG: hypothetical protein A3J83_07515 [Elusimicrobia bacterium RIFOXYA2_FULL_40_6]|nr:MAG: hypothetical protein A3J83_07515 [Elusimicrobia bacterium RIFOXYA2_FULL_40_6]
MISIKPNKQKSAVFVKTSKYSLNINLKTLFATVKKGNRILMVYYLNGSVRGLGQDKQRMDDCSLAYQSYELDNQPDKCRLVIKLKADKGIWSAKDLAFSFKEEYFTYFQRVTAGKQGIMIRDVNYGTLISDEKEEFISKSVINEAYTLYPNLDHTNIPEKGGVDFKLSSRSPARFFREELKYDYFNTAGGKLIIPPYVVSLKSAKEWFGIGTIEIPPSEAGLHLKINKVRTEIFYNYNGSATVKSDKAYNCPEIAFIFENDKNEVIKKYIDILHEVGKAEPSQPQWESWWSGPIHCFFSDQYFEEYVNRKTTQNSQIGMIDFCNEEFMLKRINEMKRLGIKYKIFIVDYGWFRYMGNWDVNTDRFPNFKKTIDDMHSQGIKVLLWYNQYEVNMKSEIYTKHPEWFIKYPDGKPVTWQKLNLDLVLADVSIEGVRDNIRKNLEFMLSDKPGCLNADGIKLDASHIMYPVQARVQNPEYGMGELLVKNIMKFIYDEAKKIKQDALINATAGNPMFNSVLDQHRLHDASSMDNNNFDERAYAANICKAPCVDADDWFSYRKFMVRGMLKKIVYGVPSFYALNYRGDIDHTCEQISAENYQLLKSITEVYLHCPISPEHEIFVDKDQKIFYRKYKTGKLKGFYSALTLSGNQAVASYSEDKVKLCAIADTDIVLPMPEGSNSEKVYELYRDGALKEVEANKISDNVIFHAQKCSRDTVNYIVDFKLSKN